MFKQLLYKAVNGLPAVLKLPMQHLPFELYRKPLQYTLQNLLAEQVQEGELDFLEERWLAVEVSDIGLKFAVSVEDDTLIVAEVPAKADVTFSGNSQDLLLVAARKQDPDTLFFRRKLTISGDTELGLAVKNMMDAVDWEQLPRLITLALEQSAQLVEEAQAFEQEQQAAAKAATPA